MDSKFILNRNTRIKFNGKMTNPIINIIDIFNRDMKNAFENSSDYYEDELLVNYVEEELLKEGKESFLLKFSIDGDKKQMSIIAQDELGIIYGLLYISNKYLEVEPFWFFNDKEIQRKQYVKIAMEDYTEDSYKVRYRGWFVNDEVLINGWKEGSHSEEVWRNIFEAILRCGGNMVIPGTDLKALSNRKLASDMGLYITHHHAEPLGAEMFLRSFPDKEPSYAVNSDLFEKMWEDAVISQKDIKVIWSVGFRGQGDYAFWEADPRYSTNEARGRLISEVICKQISIVKKYVDNPVFCTNIYGEIMELYEEGNIDIPDGVIKIWGDNGYGKMVSRRQNNNNPRVYSLPGKKDRGPNGVYYHVTFHDLQASNHLTMLPNSMEFVKEELMDAFEVRADEYLIVNCGNIKPHTYMLGMISDLWRDGKVDIEAYRAKYLKTYYPLEKDNVKKFYYDYFKNPIQYGVNADDKAGDEFYHYIARSIICHLVSKDTEKTEKSLIWATGAVPFEDQVKWYKDKCEEGKKNWEKYKKECIETFSKMKGKESQLFYDNIVLQGIIHASGCKGAVKLCIAYEEFKKKDYLKAYMLSQEALISYGEAISAIKKAEHDKWENFYKNDCLTNIKLTMYVIDSLRRYLRILGDGPVFNTWEKQELFSDNDRHIMLQTAYFNQLTDDELYNKIKRKGE